LEIVTNLITDIREGEPSELVAGDTWTWKRSDLASDFPTASWNLVYALKAEGSTAAPESLPATKSGNVYTVTKSAIDSAGYVAGIYDWTAFAIRISDSARQRVAFGQFLVLPNPITSTVDPRSHSVKMLAAIEALLEGRSLENHNSYSIKDRSLTKMTPDELMKWRDYYKTEVLNEKAAERARLGKATGRTFAARFRT